MLVGLALFIVALGTGQLGHDHAAHTEEAGHVHTEACEHGHHHQHHSGMAGIRHIVNDHTGLSDSIKKDVLNVYEILADAESAVHGMTVEEMESRLGVRVRAVESDGDALLSAILGCEEVI